MGIGMPSLDESHPVSSTVGSRLFHALLMLIMAVAGAGFAGCATRGTQTLAKIDEVKFFYDTPYRLHDGLKRDILNLAERRGVTNVEVVEVKSKFPPDLLFAFVKETNAVSNKIERVRELRMSITWEPTGLEPLRGVERRAILQLEFDQTHHNLLLVANGTSNRMRFDKEIPAEIADDIAQRFLASDVEPTKDAKYFHDQIKDATLAWIRCPENGRYQIIFWNESRRSGRTMTFTREPDTGAVKVIGTGGIFI
jgi:hypothetical protein